MKRIKLRKDLFLLSLLVLTVFAAILSLAAGQVNLPLKTVLLSIAQQLGLSKAGSGVTPEQAAVLWHIRLPRMLVGLLVGAALGVSGAVMQGVFGNPLADPGIIGVSAGASLGAVIAIALGITNSHIFVMPLFAVTGAALAVSLTVALAMKNGRMPAMILLLAGVAVNMLAGALTSGLLTVMNERRLQEYLFWLVGGLDYRRWEHVYLALGPVVCGILLLCLLARQLNILSLGDQEAKAVGAQVAKLRLLLLFLASITTATAVCVSGTIGFVGLIVPHILRLLIGPEHRLLLPASALFGALFIVACDMLGRIMLPPSEIRVGIMTALLGAPYFLFLLRRAHKGGGLT